MKIIFAMKKLRGHVDAVHKVQPTLCDICSQVFKNVHALRVHKRKLHEEVSLVSCPSCSKVFENKIKLYDHKRAVHTLKDSKCPDCGKTYKNKNLLQKHVKVYHKDLCGDQKIF
jgi:KRAB domain-containing zinc finger protein